MDGELALSITRRDDNSIAVLSLEGELDIATAGHLPQAVHGVLRDGFTAIAIDLSDVRLLDSVGLNALLHVRRRTWRRGASVVFACSSDAVTRVLQITGLHRVLDCAPTLEDARVALQARSTSSDGVRADRFTKP